MEIGDGGGRSRGRSAQPGRLAGGGPEHAQAPMSSGTGRGARSSGELGHRARSQEEEARADAKDGGPVAAD